VVIEFKDILNDFLHTSQVCVCVYAYNRGEEFVAVINVFPGCAYHKPVMVRFPDKSEWQNGFNPEKKGGYWSGIQMGPRPIKILVLGI
jgi:hypothetical protein